MNEIQASSTPNHYYLENPLFCTTSKHPYSGIRNSLIVGIPFLAPRIGHHQWKLVIGHCCSQIYTQVYVIEQEIYIFYEMSYCSQVTYDQFIFNTTLKIKVKVTFPRVGYRLLSTTNYKLNKCNLIWMNLRWCFNKMKDNSRAITCIESHVLYYRFRTNFNCQVTNL